MAQKKTYAAPSFLVFGSFEKLTQQWGKDVGASDGVKYQGISIGS